MHPDTWLEIGGSALLTAALAGLSVLVGRALTAGAQGGWRNTRALKQRIARPLDHAAAYELLMGLMVAVALYGVARSGGQSHLWPVLVLALLGFVGTVTFAKALMRGRIIE